jgi:hypothetical protein
LHCFRREQWGPARFLTYSKDPHQSNFTVGQEGRRIHFRLRTPLTGAAGVWVKAVTQPVVDETRDMFVAATYDGRVSRVYADGRLVARVNLSAGGWRIRFLADSGLPAASTLTGMLVVIALLSVTGGGRRRWVIATLGGLAGGGLLLVVGATGAVPTFAMWVPLFSLAGGLVVAAAAERGNQ